MAKEAEAAVPPPFRERLVWDAATGEIRDGELRYLMIRPDALMGVLRRLPAEMQPAMLQAFAESIHHYGAASARKYRGMGAADAEALLAVIAATAPQLGWGIWRLSRPAPGRLELEVGNSPFAAGHGPADGPVCAPIAGMLRAVAGLVLDGPASARELACTATGAPHCRFEAGPG